MQMQPSVRMPTLACLVHVAPAHGHNVCVNAFLSKSKLSIVQNGMVLPKVKKVVW